MSKSEKRPIFVHDPSLAKLNGLVQICHIGFPIYSLVCVQQNEFMIGGGGGPSKTGVQNGWVQIRVITHDEDKPSKNNSFTVELTLPIQSTRDSVMAMDVTTCPTTKVTRMAIAAGPYCNIGPYNWAVDNEDPASDGYIRWIRWWPSNIKPSSSTPQYIITLSDRKNQIDCYPLPSSNTKSLWALKSHGNDYRDIDILDPPDPYMVILCASEVELYKLGKTPILSTKFTLPSNLHGRRILLGKRTSFGKIFVLANCGGHLSKSLGSLSSSMSNLVSRASMGSSYILIYDINQLESGTITAERQTKIYHKPISVASLSIDGMYLSLGTNDGSVHVLKWESGKFSSILTIKELHALSVTCMVFDIASRFLITGGPDQTLAIISLNACSNSTRIFSSSNFGYYVVLPILVIILLIIWNSWQ